MFTTLLCVCLWSVWQWEGDEGQWEPYSSSACALLDSAVSSGETSVTLALASESPYEVDLKKMVQINPVTKYKRKIRSHPVKPGVCCVSSVCNIRLPANRLFYFKLSSFLSVILFAWTSAINV